MTTAVLPHRTPPNEASRAVAASGVIAALLFLVPMLFFSAWALSPAGGLDSRSSGAQIVRYAATHRGQLFAGDLLVAVGLPVLIIFAAGLYRMTRRAEGEDGWLAMAALACAVAGAGIFGAGTAVFLAVTYRPATDPAVVRALWDVGWMAYNSCSFAFSTWIALVTVSTIRCRVLPPWTAWVGVPVALINCIGPFALKAGTGAFSPQGSYALIVGLTFGAWVTAIAFAAWRSPRRAEHPMDQRQEPVPSLS